MVQPPHSFVHGDGCEMTACELYFRNWVKNKVEISIVFPDSLRESRSLNEVVHENIALL